MSRKKTKQKNLKLTIGKLLLMVIICLAYYIYAELNKPEPNPNLLSFSVIDVGQGSSTLIEQGGHTMLVDCGEKKNSADVISFLKDHNIEKIDTLVLTHMHTDHYGAAVNVMKEIPVGTIVMPNTPKKLIPTAKSYSELLEVINQNDYTVCILDTVSQTNVGECQITYLDGYLGDEAKDLNNTSLCLRADFGEASFLITGDAEVQEKRLVENNDCDVDLYVAGHHGSRTSSSKVFLEEVTPSIIVISCGLDNSYGHPHKEAMERFIKTNAPIYRTDQDGTLVFTSDGKEIKMAEATKYEYF